MGPRIKINEKYANYISQTDNDIEVQPHSIIQVNPVASNITSISERIRDLQQPVSNGPPNKTLTSASTLTSKLRNTKISDIRAQKAEESQNIPLDLSSSKSPHIKRSSHDSMDANDTKRPKLHDSMRRK